MEFLEDKALALHDRLEGLDDSLVYVRRDIAKLESNDKLLDKKARELA